MSKDLIRIVVAETSTIIRNGLVVSLKRIPGLNIHPVEVTSPDYLKDCIKMNDPDILIINPVFGELLNINRVKEEHKISAMKCIALLTSNLDKNMLKDYDDTIDLYDDLDTLGKLIARLTKSKIADDVSDNDRDLLSTREKEVVIGVVKGMTNKEIAEKMFLSTHTVITHRRNIARKLQIHSSAGLTIYAIVNKLVELQDIKGSI